MREGLGFVPYRSQYGALSNSQPVSKLACPEDVVLSLAEPFGLSCLHVANLGIERDNSRLNLFLNLTI